MYSCALVTPRVAPDQLEEQPRRGVPILVTELTKRFSSGGTVVTALEAVSLSVPAGGLIAIMGPSGSGKSTLLHLLGAMDMATSGQVKVGEHVVTDLRRPDQALYRRQIGFVFQRFHLLSSLTALDNVAAPVLPYRTSFDKHQRAASLLAAVGLRGRERAFPSELSGGQQQRVAIARALINDPILLLADEPTGNLDSQTGAEIVDLLLDLRARREMTVIVATHDTLIASRCDRIVRLLDGRVRDEVVLPSSSPMSAATLERITRPGQ